MKTIPKFVLDMFCVFVCACGNTEFIIEPLKDVCIRLFNEKKTVSVEFVSPLILGVPRNNVFFVKI